MIQFKDLINEFLNLYPGEVNYREMIGSYNFTDDIPKHRLFVKLNQDISVMRREQITNGIRSFFRDDTTILIDKKMALEQISSSLYIFQIFNNIVGVIALILAYFLLKISTTQNVRENIWEYGALRAMGLSKMQGIRAFLYEQYSVIISSLIIGSFVGLIIATVVTAQFFLFMEFPLVVELPVVLICVMFAMAFLTTFFAVWIPVDHVNGQTIAQTIKGLSQS